MSMRELLRWSIYLEITAKIILFTCMEKENTLQKNNKKSDLFNSIFRGLSMIFAFPKSVKKSSNQPGQTTLLFSVIKRKSLFSEKLCKLQKRQDDLF